MKNLIWILLFLFTTVVAQVPESTRQYLVGRNYLSNGGGEQGIADWTASGGTLTRATAQKRNGSASIGWDASSSSQTLSTTLKAIPTGDGACLAEFYYYGFGTADIRIYIKDNSAAVIGGYTATDTSWVISAAVTSWTRMQVPFQCPASGTTVQLVVESQGNAAIGHIDDAYIGRDFRIGAFGGYERIVAATRTSSTQTIATTSATQVIYNSATFDKYSELDTSTGIFTAKIAGTVWVRAQVSLSSYNASERNILNVGNNAGTQCYDTQDPSTSSMVTQTICAFDVTVGDTVTVKSQSVSDASYIVNNDNGTLLDIYRSPLANQQTMRGDTTDLNGFITTPGKTSCSWSSSSASMSSYSADTDCDTPVVTGNAAAPATKIPAIIAPTLLPGRYRIEARGTIRAAESSSGTQFCGWEIYDGSSSGEKLGIDQQVSKGYGYADRIVGEFTYTSKQTNKQFEVRTIKTAGNAACVITNDTASTGDFVMSITPLSQGLPRPFIPGSSFYGRPNVTKSGSARVTCGASSSIVSSNNVDSMVSSIANIATDNCVVTLATGYFSATPHCYFQEDQSTSKIRSLKLASTSATSIGLTCRESSSGTVGTVLQACSTDSTVNIFCTGNN